MSDEDEGKAGGGDAGKTGAGGSSPIDELRDKVSEAANAFLKARLGLEEGVDGTLRLPERGVFENIGQRADQFVRGFFRGFVAKTPEEREAAAGLRDPKDVPGGTEIAARLLGRVSETMSGAFHAYLKDHVVDPNKPEEQVVVDGRFVLRHGAPLIATFVQALGTRFSNEAPGEGGDRAPEATPLNAPIEEAPEGESGAPHVDYRVDLPSVFTSLFVRPPAGDEGDKR